MPPCSQARPHPRVFCAYVFTSLLGQFAVYISFLMFMQHRAHAIMPKVSCMACMLCSGLSGRSACSRWCMHAMQVSQKGLLAAWWHTRQLHVCCHLLAPWLEGLVCVPPRANSRKLLLRKFLSDCAGGAAGAGRRVQAQPDQHHLLPGQLRHPGGMGRCMCWVPLDTRQASTGCFFAVGLGSHSVTCSAFVPWTVADVAPPATAQGPPATLPDARAALRHPPACRRP